jgi:Ser/Thr protein kinase RdoA (MazF antagonist)
MSLRRLHEALAACDLRLPTFRVELARARGALSDDRRVGALAPVDRAFLRMAFDDLLDHLDRQVVAERALHGEPHGGNSLWTRAGLRWIDFESACRGPLEWDLAFLPDDAREAFPDTDVRFLELLRLLNSARVATWCWVQARFPEMR